MANQVTNVSHAPRQNPHTEETTKPAKLPANNKPPADDTVTISSAGKAASTAKTPKS